MEQEHLDQLESLIDAYSLGDILEALTGIAYEKAAHILANWQDNVTAQPWQKAAILIDKITGKIDV